MHPSAASLLKFFEYKDQPPRRKKVIKPFHDFAHDLANHEDLSGPELTVALRKLVESKDAALRAL